MKRLSIESAGMRIFEAAAILEERVVPIEESFGCVLSEDLAAEITQPPFRRSAMDGYAVRKKDIHTAAENSPVMLPVVRQIYAGDLPMESAVKRSAVRIMTGAPVPDWADVVIPQEYTDEGEEDVRIFRELSAGMNCIPAGEDCARGDVLAESGERIRTYTIAAGVAAGVSQVRARGRIKAAVLTTGSELAETGTPIRPGQIYNSNKAYFSNHLRELGCEVTEVLHAEDDPQKITEALRKLIGRVDLIVTTGGVSVGKKDYMPEVIDRLGIEQIFHGIAVKPGSPTLAAAAGRTMLLCLSGSPYSAIAMFELLFPYYEQKALNLKRSSLRSASVRAKNSFPKKGSKRRIVRGILDPEGVFIPQHQKNGQLRAGIPCNCLVDIPGESDGIRTGDKVKVLYR